MIRKALIAGNWKMHGSDKSNEELVNGMTRSKNIKVWSEKFDILICPPTIFIPQIKNKLVNSPISVGAQDVSEFSNGAYTGQVSATMLKEQGCKWVIIGHSERRQGCFESNQNVINKIKQALHSELRPIVCLGETQQERENNNVELVLTEQLSPILNSFEPNKLSNLVLAYEPVWAIGTGLTATPEQAQAVHAFIRAKIADYNEMLAKNIQILYGGSVKPDNALALFTMEDIDGALIGGASLSANDFLDICAAQYSVYQSE